MEEGIATPTMGCAKLTLGLDSPLEAFYKNTKNCFRDERKNVRGCVYIHKQLFIGAVLLTRINLPLECCQHVRDGRDKATSMSGKIQQQTYKERLLTQRLFA